MSTQVNISENLQIRQERLDEHHAVEELTRDTFWDKLWGAEDGQICDEHLLVHRLRTSPALVPELNLVAVLGGKLVGHIIYTKSKIVSDTGTSHEMLTFGPLSVRPGYQGLGIGRALMSHSFAVAKGLGYRAVLIFGHADYYPRVGFRRAAEFGITTHDGKIFDPFMAYPLYDGAMDGIQGRYYLDPVYEGLTQEDAREFDKRFPARELFTPAPIGVLLERLEPAAREAVAGLGFRSIGMMQTKSERELLALDGVDACAISTIKAVMREYYYRWGAPGELCIPDV